MDRNAVWTCRKIPTFGKNMLPSFSVQRKCFPITSERCQMRHQNSDGLERKYKELAQLSRNQQSGGSCVIRNPSTVTMPPTYEALMMGASASHGAGGGGSTEAPPPTYEEAMFLIGDEKLRVVLEESKYATSSEDGLNKEPQGATAVAEFASPSQHKPYEAD
ncbi:uncharacterized protein LOC110830263 isoform X3 [Zootermopsis nevadensis]|uniref:uncharacterized protein LOC110830263 isoform X3 n=1 Tax=Zootermopsis nevadensis TaxID=136037 RepID=UPI000B8E9BCE|nr:uncharacterized protein LOC110830263 isoform X3 [Zootermopsis nevadensis]